MTTELVTDQDEAAVLYTSGTTSRPKGVVLTHANYIYGGETVARAMGLRSDDRFLTVLPLFHGNAQYYSVMSSLVTGATVILGDRFSASRYFPLDIRHGATVGSLFAAPIRMLLAQPENAGLRDNRLRLVLFAQNITGAQVDEWMRRFGAPLIQLYGMTETIGTPTMNPVDGSARPESIGRVTLGYVCRVVAEDGTDARPGRPGELLVGGIPGVSLMKGYLKEPEATNQTLVDGWLRTGDVVQADSDGYLYFIDRKKDMIKRSGENVAASEVESAIKLHPAVFDAAVVGVPDPVRDEAIVAFVVLREGASASADDIVGWCSNRLARFRVPSVVQFRPELPRTSVGKIQKHLLKSEYLRRP